MNDPHGTTRWDFYEGGTTHPLFWITIALDSAAVLLLGLAGINRTRAAGYGGTVLLIAALVTGALTVFGFTLS